MNTDALTDLQRRVFDLVIQGHSNGEIAKAVYRSVGSVKTSMTAILKHFACDSRARLIARHYLERT